MQAAALACRWREARRSGFFLLPYYMNSTPYVATYVEFNRQTYCSYWKQQAYIDWFSVCAL